MTELEFYCLYKRAASATSKAKQAEAEAANLRAELMAAMDARGVERIHYERDGGAKVVNRASSTIVDTAKLKAGIPDWESRFGKRKAGSRYVTFTD